MLAAVFTNRVSDGHKLSLTQVQCLFDTDNQCFTLYFIGTFMSSIKICTT